MTPALLQLIRETARKCALASHNCVLTSTATTACEREITALVQKIVDEQESVKPTEPGEVKP